MFTIHEKLALVSDGMADATEAIQEMLDKCGDVYIPSGNYKITHPLIIHNNTRLVLAPDAHLKVADHANCSLIDNDGLYTRERNHDITVIGGIWDGNHVNQERRELRPDEQFSEEVYIRNELLVVMMRFVHIDRLTMQDMVLKNPICYGVHIADAVDFTVENIHLDYELTRYNMDGVHIQGPARFGKIRNINGAANDDQVALCTEGTARSEITKGDIEDVVIDGVYSENGYTGVRLLSCGSTLRNVHISNVCGSFRFYAVSFTHHYPIYEDTKVLLENIHVSDLYVSKSDANYPSEFRPAVENGPLIWFERGVNCRNVVLENIFRREVCDFTKAPTIALDAGVTVDGMRIRNVMQTFPHGNVQEAIRNQAEVRNLSVDGILGDWE